MKNVRVHQSVATRLVACMIAGGAVISLVLTALGLHRADETLQAEVSQDVALTVRNMQTVLSDLLTTGTGEDVGDLLAIFTADERLAAARLRDADNISDTTIAAVGWPAGGADDVANWQLQQHVATDGTEIDLQRPTRVSAPFRAGGRRLTLELLVDGPAARARARRHVYAQMGLQWLLMAVMTLVGLLMLRRWLTGPLSEISELVAGNCGAETFYRVSRQQRGEFSRLAQAIGGMLTRIDATSQELRRRERAFQSLYQFAPVAMCSLDQAGRIIETNHRATEMFRASSDEQLVGQDVEDFVQPADRAKLRGMLDRTELQNTGRCEVRLVVDGRPLDVVIECVGVFDHEGHLEVVRLSISDVTAFKQLQHELENQSALINLVIDHMSDAILLVDSDGRIAAHNQKLATLLHRLPDSIIGRPYDPTTFWDDLGITDREHFVDHLRKIESDATRPAQQRFVTRTGAYLFQGIPVNDVENQTVGRLWVVEEITSQEQSQRLIELQAQQLLTLRQLGQTLGGVSSVDGLTEATVDQLYAVLGVDAVGIALRGGKRRRAHQFLHRGDGAYPLEPNRDLIDTLESRLMPQILSQPEVTFWPELPKRESWSSVFERAGLTCVAGVALHGTTDSQGILWISRRGGERLERHHIYLLETLAPLIAARIEIAQLTEGLGSLHLVDTDTVLPSRQQLEMNMIQIHEQGTPLWSLMAIDITDPDMPSLDLNPDSSRLVLCRVARLLSSRVRKSTTVARLGPTTFAILFPQMPREHVLAAADRLRIALAHEQVIQPNGAIRTLAPSIGVAHYPGDGHLPEDILACAEARMRLARQSGANCVVEANPRPRRRVG